MKPDYVTLFLNPNRHFVLLAAKVHWTICLSLATSGKGLAIAPLKYFKLNSCLCVVFGCHNQILSRCFFSQRAKIEKDWKIFYKNRYFCKSFTAGKPVVVFRARKALVLD
jgi:hypothetical protein